MLSTMDDYPLHQTADVIAHVASSDRNFYDRYYFNLMSPKHDIFIVFGLGQYPNLGTQDGFVLVRHGDKHHVIRASRELGDRADISVGPLRIEVLEGLSKLRIIVDDNELGIRLDAVFEGEHYPHLEPRHYIRKKGRVLFDTMRFAQLGRWNGQLTIGSEIIELRPEDWMGNRDRSWGVRPVGEPEPQGIQAGSTSMEGMWNYFPVMFDDFVVLCIINENNDGSRTIEESMRIWKDSAKGVEWLGRPEHAHEFVQAAPYKAQIKEGVIRFPDAPGGALELRGKPLLQTYLTAGTGYGLEADWRHGMYQGPLKVQAFTWDVHSDADKMWGLIETPTEFTFAGKKGFGMMEFAFFSAFDRYTG